MTTIDLINVEIGRIPEEHLGELYGVIREFTASITNQDSLSIMAKLRKIKIEGPVDFSENIDQYLTGDKRVGENIH